jgi:uncharacterized protein (TIGR02300 family)
MLGFFAFDRGPGKWQTTRPSETDTHAGSIILVKADLGIKRVCPSCAARFYDLQKRPIECPKCQYSFEPESLYKQRRPRQPEAVKVQAAVEPDDDDDEDDENEEAETEEVEAEVIEEAPIVIAGDDDEDEEEEVVTPEEEAAEAGMSVVEGDEAAAIEDIEGDDEEEADDGLLETVEEDDDVSDIIDADIEKDDR